MTGFINVSGPTALAPVIVVEVTDPRAPGAYTVTAAATKAPGDAGHIWAWKAFLRPAQAGGDVAITATSGSYTAKISHVTFGDVW